MSAGHQPLCYTASGSDSPFCSPGSRGKVYAQEVTKFSRRVAQCIPQDVPEFMVSRGSSLTLEMCDPGCPQPPLLHLVISGQCHLPGSSGIGEPSRGAPVQSLCASSWSFATTFDFCTSAAASFLPCGGRQRPAGLLLLTLAPPSKLLAADSQLLSSFSFFVVGCPGDVGVRLPW